MLFQTIKTFEDVNAYLTDEQAKLIYEEIKEAERKREKEEKERKKLNFFQRLKQKPRDEHEEMYDCYVSVLGLNHPQLMALRKTMDTYGYGRDSLSGFVDLLQVGAIFSVTSILSTLFGQSDKNK